MLWAKQQGPAVLDAYIDGVYLPFWKRELDVEDVAVIEKVLVEAGATTAGFTHYAEGEGKRENDALQEAAFDSGIFGVPSYIAGQDMYFGREHLPHIRWQLTGQKGPAPDIANPLFPDDVLPGPDARRLDVGLDPASYERHAATTLR